MPVEGAVRSRDVTSLGYIALGSGPPLVICHGAFSITSHWLRVAKALAGERTVYVYDRRGRGRSPAVNPGASPEAHVDDLAAMAEFAGPEAAILGHSFGGGCALRYAVRDGFSGQLVLYEPVHSAITPISLGRIPDIEQRLASGDAEGATAYAIAEVVGMPAEAVEGFRASPFWAGIVGCAAAFPDELRLLDSFAWQVGDLDAVAGRVTLLLGGETRAKRGVTSPYAALVDLIPGLTVLPVMGQGHVAHLFAPDELAALVAAALRERL